MVNMTFKEYLKATEAGMVPANSDPTMVQRMMQQDVTNQAASPANRGASTGDIIKKAALNTAKKANPLAIEKLGDMAKPGGVAAMKKK
jgi:hypothetical protein